MLLTFPADRRLMLNHQEKETILIVDDKPTNLSLLVDYLRGFGFIVLTAENGESALWQAAYMKPDLILLDVLMPGLDGFETCRRLKAAQETRETPVIFITGLPNSVDKLKGFKLGAVDYITKPLQCEEVLARVRTHLTTRNLYQRLQAQNERLRQEMTQRLRVLEALRESRGRYRLLAENSTDMISQQTLDGVYHYVSPACQTLLGYEIKEMIGHSVDEFVHPEDLPTVQKATQLISGQISIPTITYRARCKDQYYIWLETTSRVISNSQTSLELEIVGVSRNVTERKQAEAALQKAHAELEQRVAERTAKLTKAIGLLKEEIAERKRVETKLKEEITERKEIEAKLQIYSDELRVKNEALSQLDKIKDEFLANTSHELRTPLNGIIGIAESMIDGATGSLTPTQMHNLAMVVASGRRLSNLVNDTLDSSRLKHRELDLKLGPVDMHALTDIVLTLSRPLANQKSLQLINQLDPDLPLVNADENRVQQIMHNLVGNAIKFTQTGTVTISATRQDDMLAVTISDTGIGIPPDKLDTIFQSFEQIGGNFIAFDRFCDRALHVMDEFSEPHRAHHARAPFQRV